jgi:hypothetical protein
MRHEHEALWRKGLLFEDSRWSIHDAHPGTWSGHQGWQTIIAHDCEGVKGAPYYMLIEHHRDSTRCTYCKIEMPASIITLFKLQNMAMIRS